MDWHGGGLTLIQSEHDLAKELMGCSAASFSAVKDSGWEYLDGTQAALTVTRRHIPFIERSRE